MGNKDREKLYQDRPERMINVSMNVGDYVVATRDIGDIQIRSVGLVKNVSGEGITVFFIGTNKTVKTDFTVDSTGFSTTRFARWFDYKYGKETERRTWIKLQVMSGVKTNIITSVELTTTPEHDSKFLPQLVSETAQHFQIAEISADKGYCSRNNMNVINEVGAVPYIPFMKTHTARASGSSVWRKMWHYFMYNHDDFLQHYHKRSNAETVFHMIKSKFGDSVRSKTETAQINEVLLKVLCHNICVVIQEIHELGIEPNFLSSGLTTDLV